MLENNFMKYFFLAILLAFSFRVSAQDDKTITQAEYPGGMDAVLRFISENCTYPESEKVRGIEGKVYVYFVIDTLGNSVEIEVVRGVSEVLDQESIKVVEKLNGWTPATENGKKVKVRYTIPINFQLPDDYIIPEMECLDKMTAAQIAVDLKSVEEAEDFAVKYYKEDVKIFSRRTDKTEYDAELERLNNLYSTQDYIETDDYLYKIFENNPSIEYRVKYIYLNGSKLSKIEIDSIRSEIVKKYESGTSFSDLNLMYTMDGNSKVEGDTGWFGPNKMVSEFEEEAKNHEKDEVYFVDVPKNSWFYVVKKTHDDRVVAETPVFVRIGICD